MNPTKCEWGIKAFTGYLGNNKAETLKYDATELIKSGITRKDSILIDQGTDDEFLSDQLLTQNIINASKDSGQELSVKFREGYDHSYFFIATFIEEHIRFHLDALV